MKKLNHSKIISENTIILDDSIEIWKHEVHNILASKKHLPFEAVHLISPDTFKRFAVCKRSNGSCFGFYKEFMDLYIETFKTPFRKCQLPKLKEYLIKIHKIHSDTVLN